VLNDRTEPQPDLALLRPRANHYRDAHPRPQDVLLVIEVADTSLRYDRDVTLPLYARASIPEAWLMDLSRRRLTIYRCPGANGYTDRTHITELGAVAVPLPLIPPLALDLSGLF
jgi:Uma2 family endonuclease